MRSSRRPCYKSSGGADAASKSLSSTPSTRRLPSHVSCARTQAHAYGRSSDVQNLRRIARGDDRDEKDGLLNPDPIKDVEGYIKSDDKILPHKRFIKHCRATLVHSARIAERQTGAAQAEKHLETVAKQTGAAYPPRHTCAASPAAPSLNVRLY